MGHGSKIVVAGDETQIDLPAYTKCGLSDALERLANIEGVAINLAGSMTLAWVESSSQRDGVRDISNFIGMQLGLMVTAGLVLLAAWVTTGSIVLALILAGIAPATAPAATIDVVREPNDGYWNNVWMKKPFCAVFWGGRATEDMMFSGKVRN